jgi:hypothetical protein
MTNRKEERRSQLALFNDGRASNLPTIDAREELIAILTDLLLEALGQEASEKGGSDEDQDRA